MHAVEDDEAVGVLVGEGEGEGLAGFEVELGEGTEGVAGGEGESLVEEEGCFFAVGFDGDGDVGGAGFVG